MGEFTDLRNQLVLRTRTSTWQSRLPEARAQGRRCLQAFWMRPGSSTAISCGIQVSPKRRPLRAVESHFITDSVSEPTQDPFLFQASYRGVNRENARCQSGWESEPGSIRSSSLSLLKRPHSGMLLKP